MNRTEFRRSGLKPWPPRERKPLVVVPIRVPAPSAPIFVQTPKHVYVRSPALMFAYSLLACKFCGADDGTIVGAHSNWGWGRGKSIKSDDNRAASACFTCHSALDQGGDEANEAKQRQWWDAHCATVVELLARGFWPDAVPVPDIDNYPEQWT